MTRPIPFQIGARRGDWVTTQKGQKAGRVEGVSRSGKWAAVHWHTRTWCRTTWVSVSRLTIHTTIYGPFGQATDLNRASELGRWPFTN